MYVSYLLLILIHIKDDDDDDGALKIRSLQKQTEQYQRRSLSRY